MVWVSGDGEVERMELDLLNVGVPRASIGDLVGGDAEVTREVWMVSTSRVASGSWASIAAS